MKHIKDDKREQKRLEKLLRKMQRAPYVAVGILQDEKIDDHFSMVDLAMVHEFGSKNGHIPARSFIRPTCDAKRSEHLKLIEKLQTKVIEGKLTLTQALTQVGEVISKGMVQTINRGILPHLKPATIRRKRSSKPLVHYGDLKGKIHYDVRGGS